MQSIQICQKEKHVYENGHDGRYKCVEMLCQNNDNQDEKSYSLKTHMERNKSLIYDYDRDAEMKKKDTQTYTINDNQETIEKTIKRRFIIEDNSRHLIFKINEGFKNIIPKSSWCFTLS